MNPKNYFLQALLRNVCLFALGILLVTYSADAPQWIVMACGILFMLPGLVTLLALFTDKSAAYMPMVPFTAGGSILFGIYLLCFPQSFIAFLLYALAGVMILFGTTGCLNVWQARVNDARVSPWHFLFPILLFVAGVLVIIFWNEVAELPFLIIGYSLIIYAPLQLVTAFVIHRSIKRTMLEAKEEVLIQVDKSTSETPEENN